MTKAIKSMLFILLMALLWLPLFQELTQCFKETKLQGAFVKPDKPAFSIDSLKEQCFQKKWEDYENYNFGFRGLFVKIKNSLEYFLFKEINASDLIEGKNGFIYSYGSAERNMRGRWYNGKERNDNTIYKINFLKETIEKHGGHFLAVIVPSKESIVPENLPEAYDNASYEQRDYDDFVEGYKKNNISFIDLCPYLKKMRDTCRYPLFTKTGFHWSMYCASVAQDTILKFIQYSIHKPIPQYMRTGVERSDTARSADADFEEPMNLLFSLQQPPYFYPMIEMIPSTLKNYRPKVIIIGDSFFWQIKNLKTIYNIFSEDSKYWYYFKESLPISDAAGCKIKDIDIIEELESADVVLLFSSMGIGEFPFGVTDYYYDNFSKPSIRKAIEKYMGNDSEWMKALASMSKSKNIPLEKFIADELRRVIAQKKIIHLKIISGKYVCADGNLKDLVIANRDSAQGWETFSLLLFENNKCAIYAYNNKFFSIYPELENEIRFSKDSIRESEIFTLIKLENNFVAFKASNGKYLSVDEKTQQLYARSNSIRKHEKFEMKIK